MRASVAAAALYAALALPSRAVAASSSGLRESHEGHAAPDEDSTQNAETPRRLLDTVYRKLNPFHDVDSRRRRTNEVQTSPTFECGEVIATIDPTTAMFIFALIAADFEPNFPGFTAILGPLAQYGVEVRKICASCEDYRGMKSTNNQAFREYCGPNVYGSNVPHSGLLMTPLVFEDDVPPNLIMKPGTTPGVLYMRPTKRGSYDIPSEMGGVFQTIPFEDDLPSDMIMGFISAVTGQITILPDFMGFGETAGVLYKAYVVSKAYDTASVPLWLEAESVISEESDCASALADAAVAVGYSEAAVAAVSVANALSDGLGVSIISVQAGGGPYKLGSLTIPKIVEGIDEMTFPSNRYEYIALIGSAFSSTYEEMANYDKHQDLLADEFKCDMIDLVTRGFEREEFYELIDPTNPLEITNQVYTTWVREAIARGDYDPCGTDPPRKYKHICKAAAENDLTESLEQTTHPVTICHSSADEVISFDNVPDTSQNPLLTLLEPPVPIPHTATGGFCLVAAWLGIPQYQLYPVVPKHDEGGCSISPPKKKGKGGKKDSKKGAKSSKKGGKSGKSPSYIRECQVPEKKKGKKRGKKSDKSGKKSKRI